MGRDESPDNRGPDTIPRATQRPVRMHNCTDQSSLAREARAVMLVQRFLQMLGESNLLQWMCLAESIHTPLDAFRAVERLGDELAAVDILTFVPTFFFSSRRRHTRSDRDWSSDVCSSD